MIKNTITWFLVGAMLVILGCSSHKQKFQLDLSCDVLEMQPDGKIQTVSKASFRGITTTDINNIQIPTTGSGKIEVPKGVSLVLRKITPTKVTVQIIFADKAQTELEVVPNTPVEKFDSGTKSGIRLIITDVRPQ